MDGGLGFNTRSVASDHSSFAMHKQLHASVLVQAQKHAVVITARQVLGALLTAVHEVTAVFHGKFKLLQLEGCLILSSC